MLNAATWERQATTELTRAVRTKSALAIAMLDIDRFKVINDTYGHLVGDQVLEEITRTLTSHLRDYDLAGRFGGEEFSLQLPQTRAVDAIRIGERIRSSIAAMSIIAPGRRRGAGPGHGVDRVAALDSGTERTYSQLMAAADAALYRAKSCGRDQHHQGPERGQRRRGSWRGPRRHAECLPSRTGFLTSSRDQPSAVSNAASNAASNPDRESGSAVR